MARMEPEAGWPEKEELKIVKWNSPARAKQTTESDTTTTQDEEGLWPGDGHSEMLLQQQERQVGKSVRGIC